MRHSIPPDSSRLRYRLMDARDLPLWFELDQDPEVMRYLNDGKPSTWDELEKYFLPRVAAFTDPQKGLGLWAVNDKESDAYLGWVLARQYRFGEAECEPDNLELGWRLKREYWGKGFASEAAQALITMFQQDAAIRAFCAVADPDNLASTGVMKKVGMHYVDQRLHRTPLRDYLCAYYERPRL